MALRGISVLTASTAIGHVRFPAQQWTFHLGRTIRFLLSTCEPLACRPGLAREDLSSELCRRRALRKTQRVQYRTDIRDRLQGGGAEREGTFVVTGLGPLPEQLHLNRSTTKHAKKMKVTLRSKLRPSLSFYPYPSGGPSAPGRRFPPGAPAEGGGRSRETWGPGRSLRYAAFSPPPTYRGCAAN